MRWAVRALGGNARAACQRAAVQPGSPKQPNILWLTTEDMSPAVGVVGFALDQALTNPWLAGVGSVPSTE